MKKDFWQKRWQENRIGFHEGRINRHLASYWQQINPGSDHTARDTVFVPLCGKAVDMVWLRERGHQIIGVELSAMACRDFFTEQRLEPEIHQAGPFTRYTLDGLTILCGDFFDLEREHLQGASLFYDRGALIALPPDMRAAYCTHLCRLLDTNARGLLITLNYPAQAFSGPPFAVPDTEVHQHLDSHFSIHRLHQPPLRPNDPLTTGGLTNATESVFKLHTS